ncbi:helix-turn-helix domain-containing protein [Lysinibacillus fusiformis]|uniref:helix-turn-helix domain-containing protein n=1 Tax=Lysinibacillus fusiformis TaxID=28031 RepID=UPI00263BCCB0|nr:helix-turn-helix domain-containing protein [Lysinibacillus fusiformis]MDC6267791.1 helix-turn-helix domain-containing protein [Lysinibacillus sphaericus]MDN4967719.1 helix-turn-helix domain-containing protein [Lysinibacillus fusiformis]
MAFEYLAQYITFDSVADMDKSVEDHMAIHYYDLTESERAIVFKLASHSLEHTGVCHLKASTIAAALEISTKTVYRSMKKLTEVGIIEKVSSTKLNGIKGASIYRILPYVPSSVSQRETVDEASTDAVCHPQSENQPSSSFYLSSFKTSNLQEVYESAHAEKEARKEYMNEYQVMLFDFMYSLPLQDELKDQLHKCILATKMNDVRKFINAKDVLANIIRDIANGTLTVASTLRAVFVGAFNKAVRRSKVKPDKSSSIEETLVKERPVPFYNWLEERDSRAEICSRPNIENWLEW